MRAHTHTHAHKHTHAQRERESYIRAMGLNKRFLKRERFSWKISMFGDAKDFESDENFDFIISFAKFFVYKSKMKSKHPPFCVCTKQLTTRNKTQIQVFNANSF